MGGMRRAAEGYRSGAVKAKVLTRRGGAGEAVPLREEDAVAAGVRKNGSYYLLLSPGGGAITIRRSTIPETNIQISQTFYEECKV